ncbi:hypothetical protein JHK85_029218 [Glycine max]|uniref:Uncharacterized protein n=1 Tax=Glycine soja TaxID=3848 RepID=A0A445IPA8_GLYSO|nr:hypothetical protein JHK85_029218 [Glycine max]KAG5004536.1 hypothetical protein JHK86_028675 [Glycine max]RZB87916.1 hypothetical protein D0Y65_027444 [Glycine soja]
MKISSFRYIECKFVGGCDQIIPLRTLKLKLELKLDVSTLVLECRFCKLIYKSEIIQFGSKCLFQCFRSAPPSVPSSPAYFLLSTPTTATRDLPSPTTTTYPRLGHRNDIRTDLICKKGMWPYIKTDSVSMAAWGLENAE